MVTSDPKTFIIDCPSCKARVAAIESGRVDRDALEACQCGERLLVGQCPQCGTLLAGETHELDIDCAPDTHPWSEIVRVFPEPLRVFQGCQIPTPVHVSIREADKCLQVGANIAACAMLGRALEAMCRNIIGKDVMLKNGISHLKQRKIIDDRLYDWSEQVYLFRNDTAHPDKDVVSISDDDAKDLQSFVYAIVEYIYILPARYDEFKKRMKRHRRKPILPSSPADL